MSSHYDINWLKKRFDNDQPLKYLFFWGHTNKLQEEVGRFCLSQWFELPFLVDGITYITAEHWMMAQKAMLFGDAETFTKIIQAEKPGEAKELGREVSGFNEETWIAHRFEIVKQGNIHKFSQHTKYADFLISTQNRILVEASPVDSIWGSGLSQDSQYINNPHSWQGLNLLGFALMEVRDYLKDF